MVAAMSWGKEAELLPNKDSVLVERVESGEGSDGL